MSQNKNSLYWISIVFILIEHGIINLLENSINIDRIYVWIAIMTWGSKRLLKIIKVLIKILKKRQKESF